MIRFFIVFIFLAVGQFSKAQLTEKYTIDNSEYIGKGMESFEDSTNAMTIGQVLESNDRFQNDLTTVPNFGITNSTYWFKFQIVNNSSKERLIINLENPLLNYATLYVIRPTGIDSIEIDLNLNHDGRVFAHQFYTFELNIVPGDSVTCYVKTQSNTQLLIPISVNHERVVVNQLLTFDIRTGIFVGLMLAMLIYNLFLYVSARDKQYLYYVNYIWWVGLAQAAVLGLFHRFRGHEWLNVDLIVPFAGAMSGIASVLFVGSFLNVKAYSKRLNYLLNSIIVADVIAILFMFSDTSLACNIVNVTAGLGSLIVLYVGFYVRRKGHRGATLFLISWGIFLASVVIFVLKDLGFIPYSQFTTYVVQIGVSIEAMLLSFALGSKINRYRKEKEESQRREFEALRENERLIKEQNELLEVKIEERTHELQVTNNSLEKALYDLKEAQSQLVESEKMASLGQLTAGVAHEINNPINFVTSNVKPLKRDLEMVWDAFSFIEGIATTEGIDVNQKVEQINAYKKKLDIDYLKTEIDYLLRGMHDGASRTAEIVKSLRIFSRVDEDVVMRADVNLGIESTLVIIGSLLGENIKLVQNLEDIPQIECYPGKLNQVFLNILTNAIYAIDKKFGNKEGGILKLSSTFLADEEVLSITIEDNGIGIPNDIINKIFEPFFTTKDVGEGTGLGMSIVYNTVLKHNGTVTVDSIEGEKTTFVVKLPVIQPV